MGYELYRRKRGGAWSVYFLDRNGGRFRRSTRQTDKRRATAVADEWYRRAADPTYQASHETSVAQGIRGLMQALEDAGKRPATRRFYAEKCGHLARLFGPDLPLARIDAKLVDGFIRDRRREGASRYTVSKELTALRQMLKHARRRGEFDKELSQVMPIGFATGYKPRDRRLTMDQAWAIIGELPEGPARYAAYVCALTARDAAVPRARGKHLTAAGVLVLDGKTARSTRLVPVPSLLFPFLFRAFWGVTDEGMVTPGVSSVRHALDRACRRLGLPHVSPNDLRRSVAHWLLEHGVPRDLAAAYMGHANTKMLDLVYGKLDPKELGAALGRALTSEPYASQQAVMGQCLPPAEISEEPALAVPKLASLCPNCRCPMVLQFWDRPGGPPGNGWRCYDCYPEHVDVVWTAPVPEGDSGDGGDDQKGLDTCTGAESDRRHADFQSATGFADSADIGRGSGRRVDSVWNPATSAGQKGVPHGTRALQANPISQDYSNVEAIEPAVIEPFTGKVTAWRHVALSAARRALAAIHTPHGRGGAP